MGKERMISITKIIFKEIANNPLYKQKFLYFCIIKRKSSWN